MDEQQLRQALLQLINVDEAKDWILNYLKSGIHIGQTYKYDLYISSICNAEFHRDGSNNISSSTLEEKGDLLMDAAWSLCLNEILRPGPQGCRDSQSAAGLGLGFSLTAKGRASLHN